MALPQYAKLARLGIPDMPAEVGNPVPADQDSKSGRGLPITLESSSHKARIAASVVRPFVDAAPRARDGAAVGKTAVVTTAVGVPLPGATATTAAVKGIDCLATEAAKAVSVAFVFAGATVSDIGPLLPQRNRL